MPSIDVHRKRRQEYLALLSKPGIFKDPHDLLQLYHECIIWIIDTYGAADTELVPLLEDATSGFMEEERVWDDDKYLELWELYAELVGTASEDEEDEAATWKITTVQVYDTMFELGIGRHCARVYRRYMELLEEDGRLTEAWEIAKKGHARELNIDSDSDDDSENEFDDAHCASLLGGDEGYSDDDSELNPSHFDRVSGTDSEDFTFNEEDDEPSLYNFQRLTSPTTSAMSFSAMNDESSSSQSAARASLVHGAASLDQLHFKTTSTPRHRPLRRVLSDSYPQEHIAPRSTSNIPRLRSPLVEEYLRSSKRAKEHRDSEQEQASLHFLDLTPIISNADKKKSAARTGNKGSSDAKRSRVFQLQEICRDYLGFSGGTVVSLGGKRAGPKDDDEAPKAHTVVAAYEDEIDVDYSRSGRISPPPPPPSISIPPCPPQVRASSPPAFIHTTIRVIEYARKRRGPSFEVLQYRRERRNAITPIIPSPLNPSAAENPDYWERLATILKKRGRLPRVYDAPAPPIIGVVRARSRCETQACASDRMRHCSFCREDAGRLWKKVCLREHGRRHYHTIHMRGQAQHLPPNSSSYSHAEEEGAGLDEEQMFFARLSDDEIARDSPAFHSPTPIQTSNPAARPPRADKPVRKAEREREREREQSPFQYAPAEVFPPVVTPPRRAKLMPAPVTSQVFAKPLGYGTPSRALAGSSGYSSSSGYVSCPGPGYSSGSRSTFSSGCSSSSSAYSSSGYSSDTPTPPTDRKSVV